VQAVGGEEGATIKEKGEKGIDVSLAGGGDSYLSEKER